MNITGIDRITYGVDDFAQARRFWLDWGLTLTAETPASLEFTTLDGTEVGVRHRDDPALGAPIESGNTLREVIWGVANAAALADCERRLRTQPSFAKADGMPRCTDPIGLRTGLRVSRRRQVDVKGSPINTYDATPRIDAMSPVYDDATPIKVGHVVLFTDRLEASERFYTETLGFIVSDRYKARASFLRCEVRGGHHNLFLLQTPDRKVGLNHVAFTVRDIHEVFGGGLHISRCGWPTEIGPGRHPISSAYFWYVRNPCGGLAEYYSNEDFVTERWQPREFEPSPEMFAEWAIVGGIDGFTRRQAGPQKQN
jgi:catechol 2,3-dioxygenase-like lactoylglutathione lyase family enzyme